MKTSAPNRFITFITLLLAALASSASASELITNGGFEDGGGSFAGWTVLDQAGGTGSWFIQSGSGSPLNGFSVPPPPGPTHAAMTDQTGPGSHVMFQDFTVPIALDLATLQFDLFLNNQASDYFAPPTLDFNTTPNQQARVDIITTAADPFSVAAGDVLLNLYQTNPGDPLLSGYTTVSNDLTVFLQAHLGETLRLRFAEVDNQLFFDAGVDSVSLMIVPEPATWALTLGGIVLLLRGRRLLGRGPQS